MSTDGPCFLLPPALLGQVKVVLANAHHPDFPFRDVNNLLVELENLKPWLPPPAAADAPAQGTES